MRYVESDFAQGLLTRQAGIDQALTAYVETAKSTGRMPTIHEVEAKPKDIKWLLDWSTEIIKLDDLRVRLSLASGDPGSGGVDPSVASSAEMNLFRAVLLKAQASVSMWGGTLLRFPARMAALC